MSEPLRVLFAEDNPSDCALAVRLIERAGYTPEWRRVETASDMRNALRESTWDVIIADYAMPGFGAPQALAIMQEFGLDVPFIVVSGTVGEDVAVQMMKAGSQDYLLKGKLTRLVPAIERELIEARNRRERREALSALQTAVAELTATLESTADAIVVFSDDGTLLRYNQRFLDTWNLDAEEVAMLDREGLVARIRALAIDADRDFALADHGRGNDGEFNEIRLRDGRILERYSRSCSIGGRPSVLAWSFRDISARRRAEQWQAHFKLILQSIVEETPLSDVLHKIALSLESVFPGALCSIHLLSPDGRHLRHGAAPSLPESFNALIDGLPIGVGESCCGETASSGATVIAADIEAHPNWSAYRDIARSAGLRACWSQAIPSANDAVLGSFALYRRHVYEPSDEEREIAHQAARLAGLAIDRSRHQEQLRLARVVFEHSVDVMLVTDADSRIIAANPSMETILGFTATDIVGRHVSVLGIPEPSALDSFDGDRWRGELPCRRQDGESVPMLVSVASVGDRRQSQDRYILTLSDLSEQKRAAKRIEQLAFYDALTGLPNRALFVDRMQHILATNKRREQHGAVLFLDLNRFKEINDSQGHVIGDDALRDVAHRFAANARDNETLARLGGDEFVLIAEDVDASEAATIAERLTRSLVPPLRLRDQHFEVSASIGIVLFPDDGDNVEDLLKRADIAMYRAKSRGEPFCFYQSDMGAELDKRLRIATRLGWAMTANSLRLYYQPKFDIFSGALVGAEALLRWYDREWGWVSPAEFVPIAEKRGMMPALGDWVLTQACAQLRRWRDAGLLLSGSVSVNLSATQLHAGDLVERMLRIVGEAGLKPEQFDLELTESSMFLDLDAAVETMRRLRQAGFSLSIDDFGTGYSSLAYLKRFAAQALKIDISFVRDMLTDREDHAIVAATIAMAHSLGLRTVAEGVEQEQQAEALRALGCDFAQGWLYGHPVSADEFAERWLSASN